MTPYTKRVVDGVVVDIPEGVEYVEPEVRELAAGIAADIRRCGHWRKGVNVGGRCILTTPTSTETGNRVGYKWHWRLSELVTGQKHDHGLTYIADFNDSNPTPVVLARLDAIAEGLVSS